MRAIISFILMLTTEGYNVTLRGYTNLVSPVEANTTEEPSHWYEDRYATAAHNVTLRGYTNSVSPVAATTTEEPSYWYEDRYPYTDLEEPNYS